MNRLRALLLAIVAAVALVVPIAIDGSPAHASWASGCRAWLTVPEANGGAATCDYGLHSQIQVRLYCKQFSWFGWSYKWVGGNWADVPYTWSQASCGVYWEQVRAEYILRLP